MSLPRGWEDLSQLIQVYEELGKKADRELIQEYIQFPKIAKDFANYLELHYKYKNDYQVERILEGEISEAAVEKLERAAFDERISVVGLLLSGLNEEFRQVSRMGRIMAMRMEWMKELHKSGAFEGNGIEAFAAMTAEFQEQMETHLEQGLISRMEYRTRRAVLAYFEEDLQKLRAGDFADGTQVWEALRENFGQDSDRYEDMAEAAGEKLEHAFDFMEAAFGGSQEMVLFVTELNTGFYSIEFLQEYDCERYYQYNKNLLFSREEELLGKVLGQ